MNNNQPEYDIRRTISFTKRDITENDVILALKYLAAQEPKINYREQLVYDLDGIRTLRVGLSNPDLIIRTGKELEDDTIQFPGLPINFKRFGIGSYDWSGEKNAGKNESTVRDDVINVRMKLEVILNTEVYKK